MCFTTFQKEKNAFLRFKNKDVHKVEFSKGVSPWLWSKIINFFHPFVLGKKCQKMCLTTFQKEKTSFYATKTRISKIRKLEFLQRGQSTVLVKNCEVFFILLFKAKQARKTCFTICQKEKTVFVGDKKKKFKKSKVWNFLKGVSPRFWSKDNFFDHDIFFAILERKQAFLEYKIKKLKI